MSKIVYKPELCEELKDLMSKGWLDCDIFAKWGICKDTFYEWKRSHPEFAAAYKEAYPKCESFYAKRLREMIMEGNDKGYKSISYLMSHKFRWCNDDSPKGTVNNTQININATALSEQDRTALIEKLKVKLAKQSNLLESKTEDNLEEKPAIDSVSETIEVSKDDSE